MSPYNQEQRTAYQNGWLRGRRAMWIEQHGPCAHCGQWSEQMEVDHVERGEKVSHRVWSWSRARREAELAKCQVLCRDCHLEKTRQENTTAGCGTTSKYRRGCRCDACRAAMREYFRDYRARQRGAA